MRLRSIEVKVKPGIRIPPFSSISGYGSGSGSWGFSDSGRARVNIKVKRVLASFFTLFYCMVDALSNYY